MKKIILISLIIILCICSKLLNTEKYTNIDNYNKNISWNVITLNYPERLSNINTQENLLNITINKFNAINGKNINQDNLVELKILDPNFKSLNTKRSNEIGCYLSHLNLIKSLKNSNSQYHIILEDDFQFVGSLDILDMIDKIIAQTKFYSFDIIFIGWANENKSSYTYFSDNLYKFNPNAKFYGTYGYIINSNSIDKIINSLSKLDMQIDLKYNQLYMENKLDIYWINPVIIEPNHSLPSTIL